MNGIDEVWWKHYRQRRYKPKRKIDVEKLIRKSLKDTLTEYVEHCSISTYRHVFMNQYGIIERLIWGILFVCMMGFALYFLYVLNYDTLQKPLIVTMESTTYPIRNIDFPAIALCNANRISKKSIQAVAADAYQIAMSHPYFKHKMELISISDIAQFVPQLGRLIDFSYDPIIESHMLVDFLSTYKYQNLTMTADTMDKLAPNCSEMLMSCSWKSHNFDCMSIFKTRRTYHGHCCTFNYVLDFDKVTGMPKPSSEKVKRQIRAGRFHGLNVIIDPLIDDNAYQLLNVEGFEVLIFDPQHYADPYVGRVTKRFIEPNQITIFELQSVKQYATDEVRKYKTSTRKCLFPNERKTKFGNMYSYSDCLSECKAKTVESLCNCVPYFLPMKPHDVPACTLDDLKCLHKYKGWYALKEKLLYMYPHNASTTEGLEIEIQDSLFCPDCLPDCEFTKHYAKSYIASSFEALNKDYYAKIKKLNSLTKFNLTNKCVMSIYYPTRKSTLDRLDVVAYWFEVMSNIGGAIGILVGFGLITVVEALYFVSVRFIQIMLFNYKKIRNL